MSNIEWTEKTWNPIVGCTVVSPGCTNCYAMKMAGRLERMGGAPQYDGTTQKTKGGAVWTGKMALAEKAIPEPFKRKKPTMYFVNSMGDLFHENVPDDWIDWVFHVMAQNPQHTFQILTKRSERMREYINGLVLEDKELSESIGPWPLPNVWLGVSCEDQARADERIPDLLATPAAVRFVSAEPLLGDIDFEYPKTLWPDGPPSCCSGTECGCMGKPTEPPLIYGIDWVIVGGESGPGARPMHPDWARSIHAQCAAADVSFFFKQWGEWKTYIDRDNDDPDWRQNYRDTDGFEILNLAGGRGFHGERVHLMQRVGKKAAGRELDGIIHDGMPNTEGKKL